MNIAQLERDLLKVSGAAAALLEKTAKECQAHEEKDKDGKIISTGRLMTDDEKAAIQAHVNEGNTLKARIERAKGDASMATAIEQLTAGMQKAAAPVDPRVRDAARKSLGQQWVESEAYKFA